MTTPHSKRPSRRRCQDFAAWTLSLSILMMATAAPVFAKDGSSSDGGISPLAPLATAVVSLIEGLRDALGALTVADPEPGDGEGEDGSLPSMGYEIEPNG
ncbi:MAG: hypothetical protein AAGM22_02660 [Acidobacteriota bacterium]